MICTETQGGAPRLTPLRSALGCDVSAPSGRSPLRDDGVQAPVLSFKMDHFMINAQLPLREGLFVEVQLAGIFLPSIFLPSMKHGAIARI